MARTQVGKVPVIDVHPLVDPDATQQAKQDAADEVRDACQAIGYFYITGHGIPESVRVEALQETWRFFHLEHHEKMKHHIANASQFRGYVPLGGEHTNARQDWHECFDIQPMLPDGHPMARNRLKPAKRTGPHELDDSDQWPASLLPSFRDAMIRTWDHMMNLSEKLTEALALGLGLPPTAFSPLAGHELCDLRLACYPPSGDRRSHSPRDAGMGSHCDNGFLTVLIQNEGTGLEVRDIHGCWTPAPTVSGAYLVLLGLATQRLANDLYPATEHRVALPSRGEGTRYSMPFFFEPRYDAIIAPLIGCTDASKDPAYRPYRFGEFLNRRFSRAYD